MFGGVGSRVRVMGLLRVLGDGVGDCVRGDGDHLDDALDGEESGYLRGKDCI